MRHLAKHLIIVLMAAGLLSACSNVKNRPTRIAVEKPQTKKSPNLQVVKRIPREKIAFPEPKKTVGDAIGTSAPKLLKTSVSDTVDAADRAYAEDAQNRAVEAARPGLRVKWKNPSTGNSGEITPGVTYKRQGVQCRQYTHTVKVSGKPKAITGTSCKGADGVWREQ